MHITVFGLNHNSSPVEIREQFTISEERVPDLLQGLRREGVGEAVILSTCNRTEIYFSDDDPNRGLETVRKILVNRLNIKSDWLRTYTYTFGDEEAYRHLFLVASGLDSMVIGEPQILGQVKDAYRMATFHNTTGFLLDKVFHRTFNVAKRIRTETKIGYNPVSISSMAVELSKRIFGDLKGKKILVIGAGEMCEIALRHFRKEGLEDTFITNRTYQNAQRLAQDIIGTAYPFEDLPVLLTKVDMVLSSTGAEKPIIDKELVATVMKKRKNNPLFFIDIAVPRDVDPSVNDVESVYLYDIDDLKDLSQRHLSDRLQESQKASTIIEEEVQKFTLGLRQIDMNPLITHIYETVDQIRSEELKRMAKKLRDPNEDTLKAMEMASRNVLNKLIHRHVVLIKENGSPAVLEIMKKLFNFEDDDEKKMDNRDER